MVIILQQWQNQIWFVDVSNPYLCVRTEAWGKVDQPAAVQVTMQLTAAGLQVRVAVSAVPIPPELPPAVPIVRPVRGMPAQVTIVITAAVLSCISEIIVKWTDMQSFYLW